MKKILVISSLNDILTNGGIQTFSRVFGFYFLDNVQFIQFKNNKKQQVHKKENLKIQTIFSNNVLYRLINKLSRGKLFQKIASKKICQTCKKEKIGNIVLSNPTELLYLNKIKSNKILVQHTLIENMLSSSYMKNHNLLNYSKVELNYFIALSNYEIESIVNKLGMDKSKIKVIRHSSDVPINLVPKVKEKKIIILSRLSKEKRIDLIIEAMEFLKDYELNIYGDGLEDKKLKQLCEIKKLKNVYFHGPTDKPIQKLDENSIFVMASDYEGYPISSIEALRRGLPIVIRETFPSARDIIQENGILLEKEWEKLKFVEAIKNCYENYERYSSNSIELGKRHNKDLIKKEWEKILV